MINLSNQEALKRLHEHKDFRLFLETLDLTRYPGLSLEQVFYFVSTGVLVEGMPLESTYKLMSEIKRWVSAHSHGGIRHGAGAKKRTNDIRKITLSAEHKDIERAKAKAQNQGTSLQKRFRSWLRTEFAY